MSDPRDPSVMISGRVLRTLEQTARLAHERFWIEIDFPRDRAWPSSDGADGDVIGVRDFTGPASGPLRLWDEVVGSAQEIETLGYQYFNGNLARWAPSPPPVTLDARGMTPLSEDEFWAVLEPLEGRLWEKTYDAAARALAKRDEHFILRWEETAALKALHLFHSFAAAGASLPAPLNALGAILGKGRRGYSATLERPENLDETWLTDNSSLSLWLGGLALDRKRGNTVIISTSFTPTQLRLVHAESSRNPYPAPLPNSEALGPIEVRDRLGSNPTDEEIDALLESEPVTDDALLIAFDLHPYDNGGTLMCAARSLVEDGDTVTMRMVFAERPSSDKGAIEAMQQALESFGGVVCSSIDVSPAQFESLLGEEVFLIKRRFTGGRNAYIDRYVAPTSTSR